MKALSSIIVACAAVVMTAGDARADDYDFIEPGHHRLGWHVGAAAGPAALVGLGDYDGFGGTGGALSLRVGTTATRKFLWLTQLDISSYVVEELTDNKEVNTQTLLTLGGQLYIREQLWLKAGGGFAWVFENFVEGSKKKADAVGIGWMGSIGIDMWRWRRFVIDLELVVGGGVYRDGVVTQGGLKLAFNWYGLRRED